MEDKTMKKKPKKTIQTQLGKNSEVTGKSGTMPLIQRFGNRKVYQLLKQQSELVAQSLEEPQAKENIAQMIKDKEPVPAKNFVDFEDDGGKAKVAAAQAISDDLDGGVPSVDPVGWNWLQLNVPKIKGNWVRFHLINQWLGGPGNDTRNLVPTTNQINHCSKWNTFEENAKNTVIDDEDPVYAKVEVDYPGSVPDGFPSKIKYESFVYDEEAGKWDVLNADSINMSQPVNSGGALERYPEELTAAQWVLMGFPPAVAGFLVSQNLTDLSMDKIEALIDEEGYRAHGDNRDWQKDFGELLEKTKSMKKTKGIRLIFPEEMEIEESEDDY